MGLQHAVPIKETHSGLNNHIYYASSSMQGYRPEQEDAHCNELDVPIDPTKNRFDQDHKFCVFGVFDGHAGAMASEYCSKHLLPCVVQCEEERLAQLPDDCEDSLKRVWGSDDLFTTAYLKCDADLRQYHLDCNVQPELGAGTTSIAVYCRLPVDKTKPHEIVCTNVGDSRAILFDGATNTTVAMSKDQKPSNDKERTRIEAAGKMVSMGRVMGNLAVARAFGDFRYKNSPDVPEIQQAVCVEPEIKRYEFTPATTLTNGQYQFVVLACDGLWDKMSNPEVSDYIRQHLAEYQIFNEEYALTQTQMEPVQRTWMHKQVSTWTSDDIASFLESIPSKFKRYFRLINNGRDLVNYVTNDAAWESLMQTKEGIVNPHDFTEAIGQEFRDIVLKTIEDNNAKLTADVQIKSTTAKLAFLTEKLIDFVVFKKRSEDNVSVTIILLKPTSEN